MLKQIKAEWFRVRSSGYNFYYIGILLIFMSLYLFLDAGENIYHPLSVSLMTFSQKGYAGMIVLAIMIIALLGNKYQNRTYYYEIMNGTGVHSIVISKILTYIFYSSIMFIIPNILIATFIATRNGLGECENPGMVVILFCIITMRIVTEAVLAMMMVRRIFAAATIFILFSMIGTVIPIIVGKLMEVSNEMLGIIVDCSTYVQVIKFYQAEYSVTFVLTVFISFVIEAIVLYVMTVISYNRKNFR